MCMRKTINISKWYENHSKHIVNGFKWFCLIIFLALTIRFVNFEKAKSAFLQISISIFISYIGILFFSKVLYAIRWKIINRVLIHKKNIPISYFVSTNLLAEFVTIALPSSIGGEVTRFMKINHHNQYAILTTTGIFIDRLIGIISMVINSIAVLLIIGHEFFIDLHAFIISGNNLDHRSYFILCIPRNYFPTFISPSGIICDWSYPHAPVGKEHSYLLIRH